MILDLIAKAASQLDWRFITPSPYEYGHNEPVRSDRQVWQERLLAYELYHQLRRIWDEDRSLHEAFIIHAEVRKAYQHIPDFDWMPDYIFHRPEPNHNLAVVEIKLASRTLEQIRDDIRKLVDFNTRLNYALLIEILIGNEDRCRRVCDELNSKTGIPIHILPISPGKGPLKLRQIRFA